MGQEIFLAILFDDDPLAGDLHGRGVGANADRAAVGDIDRAGDVRFAGVIAHLAAVGVVVTYCSSDIRPSGCRAAGRRRELSPVSMMPELSTRTSSAFDDLHLLIKYRYVRDTRSINGFGSAAVDLDADAIVAGRNAPLVVEPGI